MILIDAGAEFGYASDITRSWPISGAFSDAQREIYEIVLDAQLAAIDACKVGMPYTAPHDAARRVLAEGLIRLGVISQSIEEALDMDSGELKNWYMHNTSHWIGLDVHDAGVYKPEGNLASWNRVCASPLNLDSILVHGARMLTVQNVMQTLGFGLKMMSSSRPMVLLS